MSPVEPDPPADRRQALFQRWSEGGKLDRFEFEEIRELLPVAQETETDDRYPARGRPGYQKLLAEYAKLFGVTTRQVKRWIAVGRYAARPELPPLDAPNEMAAWWVRLMKGKVPPKMIALASLRPGVEPAGESVAIDISSLETASGDALRQARSFMAAAKEHLAEAYKGGNDLRLNMCQGRWLKAIEACRRAEQAAREDAKIKGDLIPKAELLPELAAYIQILQQMATNAPNRIRARFEGRLAPDLADSVAALVAAEFERFGAVMRHLPQIRSQEEIDEFELSDGDGSK